MKKGSWVRFWKVQLWELDPIGFVIFKISRLYVWLFSLIVCDPKTILYWFTRQIGRLSQRIFFSKEYCSRGVRKFLSRPKIIFETNGREGAFMNIFRVIVVRASCFSTVLANTSGYEVLALDISPESCWKNWTESLSQSKSQVSIKFFQNSILWVNSFNRIFEIFAKQSSFFLKLSKKKYENLDFLLLSFF